MKEHRYVFNVEWGDTDAAGIVFSPNFYKWMDQADHAFFKSLGFSVLELVRNEKIGIPLLESKCTFKRPLLFEDQVEIYTKVLDLTEKVITFEHVFIKEGELAAEGYNTRIFASIDGKLKSVPIPPEIKEAIIKGGFI